MSKIEWTDETWNVTTGCTRASEGCDNCYAVAMTKRLANIGSTKEKYGGLVNEGKDHFNGKIKLHPNVLEEPLHWRKPRRVFVNSMSDLFHPEVPFEFIDKVFAIMALAHQHTFQVLTKRPERTAEYLNTSDTYIRIDKQCREIRPDRTPQPIQGDLPKGGWPIPNVWLGTSVENQEAADERIPHLLECPAAVRFLSCEPLLGPVNLNGEWGAYQNGNDSPIRKKWLHGIHQVIAGGESGRKARPMHPDWVRSLRDQCKESNTAFFFKQWGAWMPYELFADMYTHDDMAIKPLPVFKRDGKRFHGVHNIPNSEKYGLCEMIKVSKKEAGRQLDGQEWNQMPEGA